MVVATVILLLACAAVSNCVGPEPWDDIFSASGNAVKNCHVNWTYERDNMTHGPHCWGTFQPKCDGKRQSPINIETDAVSYKHFSPNYEPSGKLIGKLGIFDRAPKFKLNNGAKSHILSNVLFREGKQFRLEQFHMHFHEHDGKGSEHRINCNGHDGELHFVHAEIGSKKDTGTPNTNFAVLAIFVEEGGSTEPALEPFFGNLTDVKCGNNKDLTLEPLEFLRTNREHLYIYEGSLTTPSCSETVIWLIKKNPISVSKKHFDILRKLTYDSIRLAEHGNVRPPFPMNDREVYANFEDPNGKNNENHKGNNNDENNGDECTEWYESKQCSTDNDDD